MKSYIKKAEGQLDNDKSMSTRKWWSRSTGVEGAHDRLTSKSKIVNGVVVHDLRHLSHSAVYDKTQTSPRIKDGHVMRVKDGVAIMVQAWPVMAHGKSDSLHALDHSKANWDSLDGGKYKKAAEVAYTYRRRLSPGRHWLTNVG